jgi:adenylate cyclase
VSALLPSDDKSVAAGPQPERATYGVLVPLGGGDPIPLVKRTLLVGRRESCDIVLRFANVSAHHCQLYVIGGYWYVKDLKSRNGVRINGASVADGRIDPGDELAIANHRYEFSYSPHDLGAMGPPPPEDLPSEIFGRSLLERAGLERRDRATPPTHDPLLHDPLLHDRGRGWS